MRLFRISLGGLSCLFALGLALWEIYFFWFGRGYGLGTADGSSRLGITLAWLVLIYLSYQLLSIPFAIASSGMRFIGVLDSMASLVPLCIVLVVMFGKPYLVASTERWEAAVILLITNCVDLFGGFAFNIALSRRTVDFMGPVSSV
jgi:hypothetical protein